MKVKTNLVFYMAILTLCVTTFGHVGYPWSADKKIPQDQASSALAGVDEAYVFLVPSEPNEYSTLWQELDKKIADKLEAAGMKIKPVIYLGRAVNPIDKIAELRVEVNLLKVEGQIVFNVRTSLAMPVFIKAGSRDAISGVVWQVSAMEAVAEEEMSGGLEAVVLGQVDKFIAAKKAAASLKVTSAKPVPLRRVSTVPNEAKAVTAANVSGTYLASKNGKVYHQKDCSSAKTIKVENLVTYGSKDQAESDGKRGCKICKP